MSAYVQVCMRLHRVRVTQRGQRAGVFARLADKCLSSQPPHWPSNEFFKLFFETLYTNTWMFNMSINSE